MRGWGAATVGHWARSARLAHGREVSVRKGQAPPAVVTLGVPACTRGHSARPPQRPHRPVLPISSPRRFVTHNVRV